jgi:hypothetical protein
LKSNGFKTEKIKQNLRLDTPPYQIEQIISDEIKKKILKQLNDKLTSQEEKINL